MSSKMQISRDTQTRIREIKRAADDTIRSLHLIQQALNSLLPSKSKEIKKLEYIVSEKTGKKLWIDKKAKKRFEQNQRKLKLLEGGKHGKGV